MAFIAAALASTRRFLACSARSSSSPRFAIFSSVPSLLPCSSVPPTSPGLRSFATSSDIEDPVPPRSSLLDQYRRKKGLSVTDVTATVSKKKERHVGTNENIWAIRLMNFIIGANQLLFEGLTCELPVFGVIEGEWIVGVIDEIRVPRDGDAGFPLLVDTKTRQKPIVVPEEQKRNARLQLMCYKYLWDNLVTNTFPTEHFFRRYELNRQYTLTGDIKKYIDSIGLDFKTLDDVLSHFRVTSSLLSQSDEQLLLRYELQSDQSLLEEYYFRYDSNYLEQQFKRILEFWSGFREASFVPEDEKWKCQSCSYAPDCRLSVSSPSGRTRSR